MAIDIQLLTTDLSALLVAKDRGPDGLEQLEAKAEEVASRTLCAIEKSEDRLNCDDYAVLVRLYGQLHVHLSAKKSLELGIQVLERRPDDKGDHSPKYYDWLGKLFSTVVSLAVKSPGLNGKKAHTLNDVFKGCWSKLNLQYQRSYLEASDKISWVSRGASPNPLRLPLKGFLGGSNWIRRGAELAQNQALMAVLEKEFEGRLKKVEVDKCLAGGEFSQALDNVMGVFKSWAKAGIQLKLMPLDLLLTAQIFEYASHVISAEIGTERSENLQDGLISLATIVMRKTGKITENTSDFMAKKEDDNTNATPGDDSQYGSLLVDVLKGLAQADVPLQCKRALDAYVMHTLQHVAAAITALKRDDPRYGGDQFLKSLCEVAGPGLSTPNPLARLSDEGRWLVAHTVPDSAIRKHLAERYVSVRANMFSQDLGL